MRNQREEEQASVPVSPVVPHACIVSQQRSVGNNPPSASWAPYLFGRVVRLGRDCGWRRQLRTCMKTLADVCWRRTSHGCVRLTRHIGSGYASFAFLALLVRRGAAAARLGFIHVLTFLRAQTCSAARKVTQENEIFLIRLRPGVAARAIAPSHRFARAKGVCRRRVWRALRAPFDGYGGDDACRPLFEN